jgi:hypothetical protein
LGTLIEAARTERQTRSRNDRQVVDRRSDVSTT